jgi:hypothetical protein
LRRLSSTPPGDAARTTVPAPRAAERAVRTNERAVRTNERAARTNERAARTNERDALRTAAVVTLGTAGAEPPKTVPGTRGCCCSDKSGGHGRKRGDLIVTSPES